MAIQTGVAGVVYDEHTHTLVVDVPAFRSAVGWRSNTLPDASVAGLLWTEFVRSYPDIPVRLVNITLKHQE